MKKCSACGQPHDRSAKKCRTCVDKENVRQKKQYQRRLADGSCPRCGEKPMDDNKHCAKCAAQVRDKDRHVRSSRLAKGLCAQCGQNSPVDGLKTCDQCLTKFKCRSKERIGRLTNEGLCIRCGRFPSLSGLNRNNGSHNMCQTCYLKHVSQTNLGTSKHAAALLAKLVAQNYKCPYTNDDLVLGGNAWVDHIMPRSRFPELAHDIDNVEWVTETVNRMKQDQTFTEFLATVQRINNYRFR